MASIGRWKLQGRIKHRSWPSKTVCYSKKEPASREHNFNQFSRRLGAWSGSLGSCLTINSNSKTECGALAEAILMSATSGRVYTQRLPRFTLSAAVWRYWGLDQWLHACYGWALQWSYNPSSFRSFLRNRKTYEQNQLEWNHRIINALIFTTVSTCHLQFI